jgi:hypothetical protein
MYLPRVAAAPARESEDAHLISCVKELIRLQLACNNKAGV